jgi:hypothetical protein
VAQLKQALSGHVSSRQIAIGLVCQLARPNSQAAPVVTRPGERRVARLIRSTRYSNSSRPFAARNQVNNFICKLSAIGTPAFRQPKDRMIEAC